MSWLSESLSRSWSQAYRAYLMVKHEGFRLLDITVWPLVLFLSTVLFAHFVTSDPNILGMIVLGALGWRVLYHFQMEPVQGIMDEYWNNSLEHLMVTPIRIYEILLGGWLSALAKITIIGAMFLLLASFVFDLQLAWGIVPGLLAVIFCGFILAIISIGVAFLKGSDSYAFIFAFTDVMAVLSGVFYPTTVFPKVLEQAISILPTKHAFDFLKATVGMAEPSLLLFILTALLWLFGAVSFTSWAFKKAKREGKLVRMK